MTVTKQMSIGQVLNLDRGTAKIFMEFGMHCLGCPTPPPNPFRTLAAPMAPTPIS